MIIVGKHALGYCGLFQELSFCPKEEAGCIAFFCSRNGFTREVDTVVSAIPFFGREAMELIADACGDEVRRA